MLHAFFVTSFRSALRDGSTYQRSAQLCIEARDIVAKSLPAEQLLGARRPNVRNDHTKMTAPHPVRSAKLSIVWPG
jgi:hypothetical protein